MEFVFVVPRERLFPACYPQGLIPFGADGKGLSRQDFEDAVRRHGFFVEREVAERTPVWKQIIPYSVVCVGEELLLMRRLPTGGEGRLHDKLSIGVGGHINPQDLEDHGDVIPSRTTPERRRNPIAAGSRREIEEEIDVQGSYEIREIGLLNDDSNPVGAVHLGLVQLVQVNGSVRIREQDMLEGRLVSCSELLSELERGANFETWSAILVKNIENLLLDRHPARI